METRNGIDGICPDRQFISIDKQVAAFIDSLTGLSNNEHCSYWRVATSISA